MHNIAILAGHRPGSKGAFNKNFHIWEFDYCDDIACLLVLALNKEAGYSAKYFRRKPPKPSEGLKEFYSIKRLAEEINESDNIDWILELHFNASENPRANGKEILHWYKTGATHLAALRVLNNYIDKVFENKKRANNGLKPIMGPIYKGGKRIRKGDNGYPLLKYCVAAVGLIEPFFGTNDMEMEAALKLKKDYVQALKFGIMSGIKILKGDIR